LAGITIILRGDKMNEKEFRKEYDERLAKLGFVLEEVGSLHIKYGRFVRTGENTYLRNRLTIAFDNNGINYISLFEKISEYVNGKDIIKSKHIEHFKSMEKLLEKIS